MFSYVLEPSTSYETFIICMTDAGIKRRIWLHVSRLFRESSDLPFISDLVNHYQACWRWSLTATMRHPLFAKAFDC